MELCTKLPFFLPTAIKLSNEEMTFGMKTLVSVRYITSFRKTSVREL